VSPRTPVMLPEKAQPAIKNEKMVRNAIFIFFVEGIFLTS
jgi:hypothetical protein